MELDKYFEEFNYGVDYNDRVTASLLVNGTRNPRNERELAMLEYMKTHDTMPAPPTDIVTTNLKITDIMNDIVEEMAKLPIGTREENIKDLVNPTSEVSNFTLLLFADINLACQLIDKTLTNNGQSKLVDTWKQQYRVRNICSKTIPEYEDWLEFLYRKGYSSPISMFPKTAYGGYVICIDFESLADNQRPVIEFTDLVILMNRKHKEKNMCHNYSLQFSQ